MSAIGQIVSRPRRLAAWIVGDPPRADPATEAGTHALPLVARRNFGALGEFLFTHRLSLTATNLDVGLRYVSGSDHTIGEKIRALLAEHDRVTDTMIERVVEETSTPMMNDEVIHGLADQLQGRLDECVGLVARSSASASIYGSAFDAGVARFDAGQVEALAELQATAHDLVRTTRDMQGELDRQRHEATRLRGELQRARHDADRDHLTGLPNRRCFESRVRKACESDMPRVVALCDIDDFKSINDDHGHPTGDRVLRLVGAHLEKDLKGKALVARHGGEEFALFFPRLDVARAVEAIDQARERLAARTLIDQNSNRPIRRITFSAGVSLLNGDVGPAMRAADRALYQAKHDGKDRVMLSDAASARAE